MRIRTLTMIAGVAALAVAATAHLDGPPPVAGPTWVEEVDRVTAIVDAHLDRISVRPDSWLERERAAAALLERARLTGDWTDWTRAERLLEEAFRLAPEGAGPHLTSAGLDFSLHRLDRARKSLAAAERRVLLDDPTRAAIEGMRADVQFQTGHTEEALAGYALALSLHESPAGLARLAHARWKTGDVARAEELYRRAAALDHGHASWPRAWAHLQLGILDLDAGRLDEALTHYRDADAAVSGWWLIEEHIAEVFARTERTDEAVVLYEDLIGRTGAPEFMDALAAVLLSRGEAERAAGWIERGRLAHEARLARFPEAAVGHALDHFLEFGDPAGAVALAEWNATLRPNGDALTALASALLAAGRHDEARAAVERAEATEWVTPGLRAVAREVRRADGAWL